MLSLLPRSRAHRLWLVLAGVVTFSLLSGLLVTAARADTAKPTATSIEDRFKALDKDGDGKLSTTEFPHPVLFKKADTNGDGFISLDEFKAFVAQARQNGGAGQPPITIENRFKALDKDGDGKLSPTEFPHPALFKKVDANGDGFVSLDEFKAFVAQQEQQHAANGGTAPDKPSIEGRFKTLDKDGDGKLSPTEFPHPDIFKQVDTNGDGFISLDEFKAFAAKVQQQAGGAGKPPMAIEDRFKALDKDGDGKLSPTEFPHPAIFKQVDANGDGFISLDEFKAFAAKMQQQHRAK